MKGISMDNKFAVKGKTKVVKGSILAPENAGLRFVLNSFSLSGKPEGDLFALFDKKWARVRAESRGWYATRQNFKLGSINTTAVQSDTWVLTMLVKSEEGKLDEVALDACLKKICEMAKYERATVHVSALLTEEMPVLADKLTAALVDKGVSVVFYEEVK